MADYVAALKGDLVEQFREKPNIEALVDVLGEELQEVFDFYEQLRYERDVFSAVGKQLDGVGDIAALTRKEAGQLAGDPIPFDVIEDSLYRQYLIFKILKNTCDCTYPDIIKAFQMFWGRPLYYTEDPEQPATMIFDTGEMEGTVDTSPLFTTPLIRAAGVTLKLYAKTRTPMPTAPLHIASGMGLTITETELPRLERNIDYGTEVHMGSGFSRVTEDLIPRIERDYLFDQKLHLGSGFQNVAQGTLPRVERDYRFRQEIPIATGYQTVSADQLPTVERKISFATKVKAGSTVYSIMETPINGLSIQEYQPTEGGIKT